MLLYRLLRGYAAGGAYDPDLRVLRFAEVVVYGKPAPAGSKRGRHNPKTGQTWVHDDSKESAPWKAAVASAAGELGIFPLFDGAVAVYVIYETPRPPAHFKKDGSPSAQWQRYPNKKPDILKLTRAVEDALTGQVYVDDGRIVAQGHTRPYGERWRTRIFVWELANDREES